MDPRRGRQQQRMLQSWRAIETRNARMTYVYQMKLLDLQLKNFRRKNSDNDDKIWPVIWDFTGQAIYRAIHPIFVSREAIYVLVLDLTKELSAIAQCCVKELDHEEAKIPAPDSNDTNLDHILRWMDLVHCFKHRVSGETLPPVILVGTHADLLQDPSDKITKVEDKIRHTARVFSDHIIRKTFLNNTLAGKQEEDPQIVSLREEILKVGEGMPHTKDDVPLKWLQVENEVYDLASMGTNYITREDFKKNICGEICQFENEDDFEVLLHFLHDRGTVVYHGCANDKRSLVVLNPE
ncbi:hypothetical protein OS493_031824 [Desmophyllum pertusum]|uniref:Uncharacterized protein n=1 Tax=Desmophyllum pertusum TaxID=174260 RepID=A0A9W9YZP6_9CNID|nr:hypothetical protein OS493_031824 [Desmophyllum pertusum]